MRSSREEWAKWGHGVTMHRLTRLYVEACFADNRLPDFYENITWSWNCD